MSNESPTTNNETTDKSNNTRRWKFLPSVDDVPRFSLFVIVLMTVYASMASQTATNNIRSTQDILSSITHCNQNYLAETLSVLNRRSAFNEQESRANLNLQKEQSRLLEYISSDASQDGPGLDLAIDRYKAALLYFVETTENSPEGASSAEFPTKDGLDICIQDNLNTN